MFNHGLGGWLFARTPRANETILPKPQGRARRLVHSDGTFNDGRNQDKREARAQWRAARAEQVEAYRLSELPRQRAPKNNLSPLLIDLLANRRLRQRNGGL